MKSNDLPFVISFLRMASSSLVHLTAVAVAVGGAFFFILLFAVVVGDFLLALLSCDLDEEDDAADAAEVDEQSIVFVLLRTLLRVLPSAPLPLPSLSLLTLDLVGMVDDIVNYCERGASRES